MHLPTPRMESHLSALRRQTPQPTPAKFLGWNPGCWIRYHDDTPAHDQTKALSTPRFAPGELERKQREWCAACFSLQAFEGALTRDRLLTYRNLGVSVDLVPPADRERVTDGETDRRKDGYLAALRGFPLRTHWLIETARGFQLVFRVMPLRDQVRIRDAVVLSRRLADALGGDPDATRITQCLRVPGCYQFENPSRPFLCRLLMDYASAIPPYEIGLVRAVLDAQEVFRDGAGCERVVGGTSSSHSP